MQNNVKSQYVCTVCGHIGWPKTKTKGSILVELLLWCAFIVPGLIYSIWRLTSRQKVCPKCSAPHMIPTNTPKGIELTASKK